ncbi:TetR/AcrR family transcriptional regulator [Phenylobacterium sp.]|uniref:TetR/AcrR family transcriptional regulator n=1 Tax=Phenylobacterium sp. TaxID=1871053 RepID=UPI00273791D6|nr:TetR/AcrR family transcriptional regulator [Phenylobacterium sp.]MDP3869995.1 TetR/AcrR family transcriptional regulator [Phenylobacterium sp.]
MARPLEFDRDAALDRAMRVFWRQGYQAASLPDLLAEMGISRSSLYAAFGDKRGLMLECLDLFAHRTLQILARARAGQPALAALRQFFDRSVVDPPGGKADWGCLLVNTVLEMAGVDDGLSAHAAVRLAQVQGRFEDCLRDAGCTPAQADELAAFLMLVNQGLRVSSRRAQPLQARRDQIATTFRVLSAAIPTEASST